MSEHPPTLLILYLQPDLEEGAGYHIDETLTTSGITYRLIGQMEKRVSLERAAPFIITHSQKRIIFALHAPLHQQGIDDMAQLVSAGLILGFVVKGEWNDLERTLSVQEVPEKLTQRASHVLQRTSKSLASAKPRPLVQQEALQPVGRLITGRIRKGLRTPESAFYYPILQVLSDLGGSAKRSEVFLILEQSMRDVLKPIDYHILSSEAEQMRWQNSAQWARNLMVKEGLLQADSPIGLWEISEKGRAFLQNKSSPDGLVE